MIVAGVLVVGGGGYWWYQSQTPQLIGGQKDEHGCLGPAGYSWCEAKQKCLRVWEEKCEATSTAQTSDSQTAAWKTYKNEKYGFEILYPASYRFENNSADSKFSIAKGDENSENNYAPRNGIIIGGVQKHAYSYNGDIIDFVKANYNNGLEDIERIQLGILAGAKVMANSEDGMGTKSKTVTIYAINPNQPDLLYFVNFWQYNANATEETEFENILSTFKFTQ